MLVTNGPKLLALVVVELFGDFVLGSEPGFVLAHFAGLVAALSPAPRSPCPDFRALQDFRESDVCICINKFLWKTNLYST